MDPIRIYIPTSSELWPSELTADAFWRDDCFSPLSSKKEYCPSAGWQSIAAWGRTSDFRLPLNVTMPIIDTNMVRYLATSSNEMLRSRIDNPSKIWTDRFGCFSASSVSLLIARCLGCLYERADNYRVVDQQQMSRPIFTVSSPNVGQILKPYVSVQCRDHAHNEWENMQCSHDNLIIPPMDKHITDHWIVPESAWRDLANTSDGIKASWVDFSSHVAKPSVGLVRFERRQGLGWYPVVRRSCCSGLYYRCQMGPGEDMD